MGTFPCAMLLSLPTRSLEFATNRIHSEVGCAWCSVRACNAFLLAVGWGVLLAGCLPRNADWPCKVLLMRLISVEPPPMCSLSYASLTATTDVSQPSGVCSCFMASMHITDVPAAPVPLLFESSRHEQPSALLFFSASPFLRCMLDSQYPSAPRPETQTA